MGNKKASIWSVDDIFVIYDGIHGNHDFMELLSYEKSFFLLYKDRQENEMG